MKDERIGNLKFAFCNYKFAVRIIVFGHDVVVCNCGVGGGTGIFFFRAETPDVRDRSARRFAED